MLVIPLSLNQKAAKPDNRCSICLLPITNIAKLDKCKHEFCLICIEKWSKFHKICPLCRNPFSKIISTNKFPNIIYINDTINGNHISKENNFYPKSQKMPDIKICMICREHGSTSSIFTCLICKSYSVHYWCEEPKFFKIGVYICPSCEKQRSNRMNEI